MNSSKLKKRRGPLTLYTNVSSAYGACSHFLDVCGPPPKFRLNVIKMINKVMYD